MKNGGRRKRRSKRSKKRKNLILWHGWKREIMDEVSNKIRMRGMQRGIGGREDICKEYVEKRMKGW